MAEAARSPVSDALWRRRYEADPSVIGREVTVNGTPATVIGVAASRFAGTLGVVRAEAWVPFGMTAGGFAAEELLINWRSNFILGVGRLRQGGKAVIFMDRSQVRYAYFPTQPIPR